MRYKSRAIALSYIKHGETSIISKLLTEEKGLQSFIIKGVRSKKSKKKLGFFQPLQFSEINATHLPKKGLQYLNEISPVQAEDLSNTNIKKSLLFLFIAEVISKIAQEDEVDKQLFSFIWNLKIELSNTELIDPNFPLIFLLKLSDFLGFMPSQENIDANYFNLESGKFTNKINHNSLLFINQEDTSHFKSLLNNVEISIPYPNRNKLLLHLIKYYKLQHHELKNMTSHIIIESLRS